MKNNKSRKESIGEQNLIADFIVEDFRFCRSYISAVDKLFPEEQKKYYSSFAYHENKIDALLKGLKIFIKTFDGCEYNEGLPVTPLNADEFDIKDNLVVVQTIEPTVLTEKGEIIRQGTVILSEKK